MWSKRCRFLLTISYVLVVASPAASQGYGNFDDDGPSQQFGNQQQRPFGGNNQFPQNQQANNLPQYESGEQQQGPRQNQGFQQPPQQQFSPQGQGGPGPQQQQQFSPQGQGGPGPQQQQQPQQPQGNNNPPWWQGQNAFQQPPGHPGVEMLAPPGQQPQQQQGPYNPNNNANRGPPQQPGFNPPPRPQNPQQPFGNPPSPPPIPQEPNLQQFNNPPPSQQSPAPNQYNPPPPPRQPQQPPQAGFGWNPPSQNSPQQNYFPQGQGQPPVDEAPGCDLINKADCHNNRRNFNAPPPPPQNYQPPPQFQPQPQQPFQPQQQQQPSIPPPNQGYQPPPQQPTQTPRPNNPYQSNQLSSPNSQQPRPQQQQRPYTPPQAPRPQQQQPQEASAPYPGCPAAMKCVQDEYCNAIGLIEDAPIQFSAADRLHRVALMECSEPMTGIVGVCCRDPNYTDPWPDMSKNGGQHHHPDKGQPQGHFQPPQGNHLQSGNPYSGSKTNRGGNNGNVPVRSIAGSSNGNRNKPTGISTNFASSSPNLLSESKQTLQVLEPCIRDELCLSMSQCHSLNPQFMAKTGLNPLVKRNVGGNDNFTDPIKIKRCKYERSGIHYLCCKKPNSKPTTTERPVSFHFTPAKLISTAFTGTTARPSTFHFLPTSTSSQGIFTLPFTFHSTASTSKPSLVTGFGLRFHSGLHSTKQEIINNKKPNPYGPSEEPIQLISPVEKIATSTLPFTFHYNPILSTQSFKFTTTPSPAPPPAVTTRPRLQSTISFSTAPASSPESISAFARIIGTSRTYISSTTALPPTLITDTSSTSSTGSSSSISSLITTSNASFISSPTTPATTTTTEGKVDISKIPFPVPLRPELKAEPPIGFIFKGDDLFIPKIETPSQNYLLPTNDFEVRTLPTQPPLSEEVQEEEVDGMTTISDNGGEVHDTIIKQQTTARSSTKSGVFNRSNPFLHNNSIEGTTIYSILDDPSPNSASQETPTG